MFIYWSIYFRFLVEYFEFLWFFYFLPSMTFLSFWTIFIFAFFNKTKKKIHENWKSLTFCERHQYLGGHTFSPFQNGSSANFSVCRIEYRGRFAIYRYKGMLFVTNNFKNLLKIWEGERGLISHSESSPLKDLNYIPSIHSFSPMI